MIYVLEMSSVEASVTHCAGRLTIAEDPIVMVWMADVLCFSTSRLWFDPLRPSILISKYHRLQQKSFESFVTPNQSSMKKTPSDDAQPASYGSAQRSQPHTQIAAATIIQSPFVFTFQERETITVVVDQHLHSLHITLYLT
jgi:hypothetical protein